MSRRHRLLVALAGLLLGAAAAPASRVLDIPARPGIPAHHLRVLTWQATAPGAPLLVYAPSWGGAADENARLAAALAQAGYTVAAIDYYTDQPAAFAPDQARLALGMDMGSAAGLARTTAEGDWRTVLMATDASELLDQLGTIHAGVFGWSFGGAVAVQACRQEPRFAGCLNMDGWMFGPAADDPPHQPFMVMSGDPYPAEPHPAGDPYSTLEERDTARLRARFAALGGTYAYLRGRQHEDFRRDDPAVLALVTAFFDRALQGKPAPILDEDHPIESVTLFRFTAPAKPPPQSPG